MHAIETGDRRAVLTAGAGLGKSYGPAPGARRGPQPRRRLILLSCPRDEILLVAALAERLGERVGREPRRLAAWRALERAIRLASIRGEHKSSSESTTVKRADCWARRGIECNRRTWRRATMQESPSSRQVDRLPQRRLDREGQGTHTLTLESLTRTQTEIYLLRKLTEAGCDGAASLPHARSPGCTVVCAGVPAQIERAGHASA